MWRGDAIAHRHREPIAGARCYVESFTHAASGEPDSRGNRFDGETGRFVVFDTLAFFGDSSGYVSRYGIGKDGRTIAVIECAAGQCEAMYEAPSDDAEQRLWLSRGTGRSYVPGHRVRAARAPAVAG